jgi:hypothetical protein
MRKARNEVRNLPAGFRYHDLRALLRQPADRLWRRRQDRPGQAASASAKTTLDTYGHIWPDRDESTRATVDAVLTAYLTEQRRNSATAEP